MRHIIERFEPFVKSQIEHQEFQAERHTLRGDNKRAQSYSKRASELKEFWQAISSALESADNTMLQTDLFTQSPDSFRTKHRPEQISVRNLDEAALRISPSDLQGLPDELIRELGISESERKDYRIVDIIDNFGGVASINNILVELYRQTLEVEKRTRLVSRLYRMQQKGLVYSSASRKGIYATSPLVDDNTANKTGQYEEEKVDIDDEDDL